MPKAKTNACRSSSKNRIGGKCQTPAASIELEKTSQQIIDDLPVGFTLRAALEDPFQFTPWPTSRQSWKFHFDLPNGKRDVQEVIRHHGYNVVLYTDGSVDSKEVHSMKYAVLLAQIRSDHCHLFPAYRHLIDSTRDPTCQVCGEAPHTMEHWLLDCRTLSLTRIEIF